MHNNQDAPDRHARTILPAEIHERLRHLSLDLRKPLADLLVQGAVLLLRYHDRGHGLPEPMAPRARDVATADQPEHG